MLAYCFRKYNQWDLVSIKQTCVVFHCEEFHFLVSCFVFEEGKRGDWVPKTIWQRLQCVLCRQYKCHCGGACACLVWVVMVVVVLRYLFLIQEIEDCTRANLADCLGVP
jgi:hypothetical protein